MNDKPFVIEDLPDELFLFIFSFIEAEDLVEGWYNLNNHINSILRSVSISIQIKDNDDYNNSLRFLEHFSSQITYIKDDRFFPNPPIDVRPLINIRSLYLIQCSNDQYNYINPESHPHLTRFFSLSIPWSFYERILFGQRRFSYLRSIGYPRGGSILLLNNSYYINRTIRHLHLHSSSNEILSKFLQYFPFIISLTIDYFFPNNSSTSISSFTNSFVRRLIIVYPLSSQLDFEELLLSFEYSNLTHVHVSFNTCDFEHLARLITKLSCMKQFHLRVNTFPEDLNLISTRLMNRWFTSLNCEHIIEQQKRKRVLIIKTMN